MNGSEPAEEWQQRLVALIRKYSVSSCSGIPGRSGFSTDTASGPEALLSKAADGDHGRTEIVTLTNKTCGDSVSVFREAADPNEESHSIRLHVRGCSLCKASAVLADEVISCLPRGDVATVVPLLCETMISLIRGHLGPMDDLPEEIPPELQEDLRALGILRHVPARQRCGLLAWEGLGEFLRKFPPGQGLS